MISRGGRCTPLEGAAILPSIVKEIDTLHPLTVTPKRYVQNRDNVTFFSHVTCYIGCLKIEEMFGWLVG